MLQIDFHCHSHFSHCGIHSIIELLTHAKSIGMTALTISDHAGPQLGSIPSPFFDRLHDPVPGIRMLKGIECNVPADGGQTDLPMRHLKHIDVVLLGLHNPSLPTGLGAERYTSLLLKTLEHNPFVDIVTHPNDATYPVDFDTVAAYCETHGHAVEINNAKTMLVRIDHDVTRSLIRACKRAKCRIAVCSDAHALLEVGQDSAVRPLLAEAGFPEELIVNRDAEAGLAFVEERRKMKAWS
jgi:putative hydrolase